MGGCLFLGYELIMAMVLRPLHQMEETREQEHVTYVKDARQEGVIRNKKRRWSWTR
jgi:hypothetical protein